MKLSSMMVAAAMMAGSVGALGCSTATVSSAAQDLAQESSTDAASNFFVGFRERFGFGERYRSAGPTFYRHDYGYRGGYVSPVVVRFAPPAARYEYIGRAPSSRHFWVNGHQSWNGREYVWVGGHWDMRRNGQTYVQPHYDVVNGRYTFMRGHWA